MANNPADQRPVHETSSSAMVTIGAVALGWALIRLVVPGERRQRRVPATNSERAVDGSRARFPGKQHTAPEEAVRDGTRGRQAETPTKIPMSGWKDILWRTYEEFNKDRIMLLAAGVTYYALLAIFPAIAALVSI